MEKEKKFGTKMNRETESETIGVLKHRNGTRTLSGASVSDLILSETYGLARSLWGGHVHVDTVLIRDTIETYFVNAFEWEGIDRKFHTMMEKILFRHGKCAIVKLPNGDIVPAQFTWKKEDEDYYGKPKKITLATNNKFNGKIITEERFVIIQNNSKGPEDGLKGLGTLEYSWERIRQITRALIDVDNASLLSRPKWGANLSADDAAIHDIENAMNSNRSIIPVGNIDFAQGGLEDLAGNDATQSRINILQFQLNFLLQLLGLSVNEGNVKAERMSEMEVAKGDKFEKANMDGEKNALMKDMMKERIVAAEEAKEKLGWNVTIAEPVEDKPLEVNGALNKAKVGGKDEQQTNI